MAKRKRHKKEQNELALLTCVLAFRAEALHCVARIDYEPIWTEDKAKMHNLQVIWLNSINYYSSMLFDSFGTMEGEH
jgi:hypothetical protein